MSKRFLLAVIAAGFLVAKTALAEIHVQEAWSPAMPAGVNQVPVYLVLTNLGQGTDRLLGASTEVAGQVTIKGARIDEEQLIQVELEEVELPAFLPVGMTMSSAYLVLGDLQRGLRTGGRYPLTLHFADAPDQQVRVRVRATNYFGSGMDDWRTDPLQQPGRSRRSEGLDDVMSDPFIR